LLRFAIVSVTVVALGPAAIFYKHFYCRFNNGHGTALLRSHQPLTLNQKHHIKIWRDGQKGELDIQGQTIVGNYTDGSKTDLNVEPELFLGGLVGQEKVYTKRYLEFFYSCI